MRRRFFVREFGRGAAVLEGETARHLARVLRAAPGQLYELSDGREVWLGRVESVTRERVAFVLEQRLAARAPFLRLTLLLAVVKFDRLEWCLEKAAELGVERVVPLAAARCDRGLLAAAGKRARRWEKILREAAQQARRLRPPELGALLRPAAAFGELSLNAGLRLLLSEREDARGLRGVLERAGEVREVTLAIGPEGGWSDAECSAAAAGGFTAVSLGGNILRTETAVIAALAAVNYALGESPRVA